ncbi:MAG: LAGLIDADG family homing endonuclease, partial [Nanoarchaeota archaeon]|nr:LAGLIDADG family homing endonuclease [Nanoarchaeota archaeon]
MEATINSYLDKLPGKILNDLREESVKRNLSKEQTKKVLDYLVEQYDAAKINPGEAIGIITAESFGEPGTQMSIAPNEKIIVKINGKIKTIEIGKFVDSIMESKGSLKFNDSEIAPLHDLEIQVPSINSEEKIEWKQVIECSRHMTNKKLIKIITKSGRQIISTDNHSFVTRSKNRIVPIMGSSMKIGDRIPVINNLAPIQNPIKTIAVSENISILPENIILENGLLCSTGSISKHIQNNIQLDWSTGWFIGAYLAEGSASYGAVSISNLNDTYIENAKRFIERVGLDYKEDFHHMGFAESRDLKVNSTLLADFISTSCGNGSRKKKVPEFAYNADNNFVAGLLRGYFDGDANFHVSRKMVRVSSNSKELLDGISLLLSRFKIFSFKMKDKKGQSWLLIPYKYAPLFLMHIGSDIEYKKNSLKELSELAKKYWEDKSQDYSDMISGFDDLFYKTSKKLGIETHYVNSFTKRQKIGRTSLYRHIKNYEKISKEKNIDISDEMAIMKRMLYSDVVWDEIESIENVDHGGYVYDLSVPGLETFTTAEGILTHNTLNVFHFAGVAEVSVTQGLPRLIEILDARKTIKTPSMEIHIKKEYNKDANEVKKIAAQIKETTLQEISEEFNINLSKMQINITINKSKMREIKAKPDEIIDKIQSAHKNLKVKETEEGFSVKTDDVENELMEIYKIKEKLKETYIKGTKGISHVLPVKNGAEFIIITAGSNLG